MPTLTTSIQHCIGQSSQYNVAERRQTNKKHPHKKIPKDTTIVKTGFGESWQEVLVETSRYRLKLRKVI